jgi:hypothetical protein
MIEIIRALILCLVAFAPACKPESKVGAVPGAVPTVVPAPPKPTRPLGQFVKEALEMHFSPTGGAEDSHLFRDRDLQVQLNGLDPADLPAQVHQTRLRAASEPEIDSVLRASPRESYSYLGVALVKSGKEGYRTLSVGFGYGLKTAEGRIEHEGSSGCTYEEAWRNDTWVIIRKDEWVQ